MPSTSSLPEAVTDLIDAQRHFAGVRADATARLSEAQVRRESAMRRVAALGLSHRRIAELTDLSHTRVNQILGSGTKVLPPEAHAAPGFLGPPSTVASAVIRAMAEQGRRTWRVEELHADLAARGWPHHDLLSAVVALTTDGVILSADAGAVTLHAHR